MKGFEYVVALSDMLKHVLQVPPSASPKRKFS